MQHPHPDAHIVVEATYNEIIALNLAIGYFVRYGAAISPVYPEARKLLDQFQQRLQASAPQKELRS